MKPLDDMKEGDFVVISKKRTMTDREFTKGMFNHSPFLSMLGEDSHRDFIVALDIDVTKATHGIVKSYDHPYIAMSTGAGPKVVDITGCTVEVMEGHMSSQIRKMNKAKKRGFVARASEDVADNASLLFLLMGIVMVVLGLLALVAIDIIY